MNGLRQTGKKTRCLAVYHPCHEHSIHTSTQKLTPGKIYKCTQKRESSFVAVCRDDTLPKIILEGSVDGRRRRRKLRKSWKDVTNEWTDQSMLSVLRGAEDRRRWPDNTAETSVVVPLMNWILIDLSDCYFFAPPTDQW